LHTLETERRRAACISGMLEVVGTYLDVNNMVFRHSFLIVVLHLPEMLKINISL